MFEPVVYPFPEVSSLARLSASQAEELVPALAYRELVESLVVLTDLGVLRDSSLATALVVARLVDRGRIARSGLTARDLTKALARYRQRLAQPVAAIERAFDQAIALAPEGDRESISAAV